MKCTSENCDKVLRSDNSVGYCAKHRYLAPTCKERQRVLRRSISRRGPKTKLVTSISGTLPEDGETAIYVLHRDDEIFYVGQTVAPFQRLSTHILAYGDSSIRMNIVKTVNEEDALYWECKHIVECIDLGYKLDNTITPNVGRPRGRRKKSNAD